jgi:hypothetical protein
MHGRKMTAADLEAIKEIARSQFDLPDLSGNNFLAKRVLESGQRIIAGAAARMTTEVFIWVDRAWESPRFRLEAFKFLHEQMRLELKEKGVEDVHAWVPPQIERAFGRRLMQLGWQRPLWTDFVRSI